MEVHIQHLKGSRSVKAVCILFVNSLDLMVFTHTFFTHTFCCADVGLTLENSALKVFTVANLRYTNSVDNTKFLCYTLSPMQ